MYGMISAFSSLFDLSGQGKGPPSNPTEPISVGNSISSAHIQTKQTMKKTCRGRGRFWGWLIFRPFLIWAKTVRGAFFWVWYSPSPKLLSLLQKCFTEISHTYHTEATSSLAELSFLRRQNKEVTPGPFPFPLTFPFPSDVIFGMLQAGIGPVYNIPGCGRLRKSRYCVDGTIFFSKNCIM